MCVLLGSLGETAKLLTQSMGESHSCVSFAQVVGQVVAKSVWAHPPPPFFFSFFPPLLDCLGRKVHDVDHGGVAGVAVVRALGEALLGDALHVPVPQPEVGAGGAGGSPGVWLLSPLLLLLVVVGSLVGDCGGGVNVVVVVAVLGARFRTFNVFDLEAVEREEPLFAKQDLSLYLSASISLSST